MASALGIKRGWFHAKPGLAHYDIPKTRIEEIKGKCRVVESSKIIELIREAQNGIDRTG